MQTPEIRVHGNASLLGALTFARPVEQLSDSAPLGTLVLHNNMLYGYVQIGQLGTWYPLVREMPYYVHSQGVASDVWLVEHNLGTDDVWFQVKDQAGQIQIVTNEPVDVNSFRVHFVEPAVGTVVVVAWSGVSNNGSGAAQSTTPTPGPAGPQGIQGEPGPAGPAGADASVTGSVLLETTEDLAAGDLVNIVDVAGVAKMRRAVATSQDSQAHGFVKLPALTGASAAFYSVGGLGGLSGRSVGIQYLSATEPGKTTATAPTAPGHILQRVGIALTPDHVEFGISPLPITLA